MILNLIFKKLSTVYLELTKRIENKKPLFYYWVSEILFFIIKIISEELQSQELNKLDINKIKQYYEIYGFDATLNNFKLSERILNKILNK